MISLSDAGVRKSNVDKESPLGFKGVDVEGVTLGDSPTAETMMKGLPDFSASTGSLGSGTRSTAKQMTVTSPPAGWSGTSWTGGLAQGCAPAFKTSASVNDLHTGAYFIRRVPALLAPHLRYTLGQKPTFFILKI